MPTYPLTTSALWWGEGLLAGGVLLPVLLPVLSAPPTYGPQPVRGMYVEHV